MIYISDINKYCIFTNLKWPCVITKTLKFNTLHIFIFNIGNHFKFMLTCMARREKYITIVKNSASLHSFICALLKVTN